MRSAEGAKPVIVGIRPESFEDAEIVSDDAKRHGVSFKAKIDLIEALGAESFAYFHLEGTRVDSDQLQEVAEDAGLGEVPSASGGGDTALVARLDEATKIAKGTEGQLWVDTRRPYLFDPESGKSLSRRDAAEGSSKQSAATR